MPLTPKKAKKYAWSFVLALAALLAVGLLYQPRIRQDAVVRRDPDAKAKERAESEEYRNLVREQIRLANEREQRDPLPPADMLSSSSYRACDESKDCTAVRAGCSNWNPVNVRYERSMMNALQAQEIRAKCDGHDGRHKSAAYCRRGLCYAKEEEER